MKPTNAKIVLNHALKSNLPVFLWGSPGIGKSSIVAQLAKENRLEFTDIRVTLLDPVDLRGVPSVSGGVTKWNPPEFFPQNADAKGILFLDELSAAPPAVQVACYQLIYDRKLGEYELPKGYRIIAAGNRESDRAVAFRMSSALASRFLHIDMEADLDDWCKWALVNDVAVETIAFVRSFEKHFNAFDPKQRSYPCPRTWHMLSQIQSAVRGSGVELDTYAGLISEGVAGEYMAFLQVFRDLPSVDAILMNPDSVNIPTNQSALIALVTTLAARMNETTIGKIIRFINRLSPEYAIMCMKDAVTRSATIASCPEFTPWAMEHSDVMFN